MPGGGELDSLLSDIAKVASFPSDLDALRATRALLAGAEFESELAETIRRSHNSPEERRTIAASLTGIKIALRDQITDRTEQHSNTGLVAIGGGTALSVGAILTAITQIAYPPLAILPLAIGVYFGRRGLTTNRRLALELSALNDMVELLDRHIRSVAKDG
jgi:hypothetical protein